MALEAKTFNLSYDSLVPTSTCNSAIPGRKGLLKMYISQEVLLLKSASRSKKVESNKKELKMFVNSAR